MTSALASSYRVKQAVLVTTRELLRPRHLWLRISYGVVMLCSITWSVLNDREGQAAALVATLPALVIMATFFAEVWSQLIEFALALQRMRAPHVRRIAWRCALMLVGAFTVAMAGYLLLAGVGLGWTVLALGWMLALGGIRGGAFPYIWIVMLVPNLMRDERLVQIESLLNGNSYWGLLMLAIVINALAIRRFAVTWQQIYSPLVLPARANTAAPLAMHAHAPEWASTRVDLGDAVPTDQTPGDRALRVVRSKASSAESILVAMSLGPAPQWSLNWVMASLVCAGLAYAVAAWSLVPVSPDLVTAMIAGAAALGSVGLADASIANAVDRGGYGAALMNFPGYPRASALLKAIYVRVGWIIIWSFGQAMIAMSVGSVILWFADPSAWWSRLAVQAVMLAAFLIFASVSAMAYVAFWLNGLGVAGLRNLPSMICALLCLLLTSLVALAAHSWLISLLVPVLTLSAFALWSRVPQGRSVQLVRSQFPS